MTNNTKELFKEWLSIITLDYIFKLAANADKYMREHGESGLFDYLFINDKDNGKAFDLRTELLNTYSRIIDKKVDDK